MWAEGPTMWALRDENDRILYGYSMHPTRGWVHDSNYTFSGSLGTNEVHDVWVVNGIMYAGRDGWHRADDFAMILAYNWASRPTGGGALSQNTDRDYQNSDAPGGAIKYRYFVQVVSDGKFLWMQRGTRSPKSIGALRLGTSGAPVRTPAKDIPWTNPGVVAFGMWANDKHIWTTAGNLDSYHANTGIYTTTIPNVGPYFPDTDSDDTADPVAFTLAENALADASVGTVTATDPEDDTITYSVGGTDAAAFAEAFQLNTADGKITVKTGSNLSFETKPSYSINIEATDGKDADGADEVTATNDDSVAVTITVTDVEETGSISMSRATPAVGIAVTATLTDPDGGETAVTWQWAKSDTENGSFTNITTATSDSYTPVTADVGKWLKVTASYTDRRGSGKTATKAADNAVDTSPHKVPAFAADTQTLTVAENKPAGTTVGTVSATDADGDTLGYTFGGTDGTAFDDDFTLDTSSGEIKVKTTGGVDYEDRTTYTITISVSDGEDASGVTENPAMIDDSITVTINVTNVDEDGVVTLSAATPQVYVEQTASVTDPDGAVTDLTWQWSKSDTADGTFTNISSATSAAYTPLPADFEKFLKAKASYTDPQGSGKTAEAVATNAVGESPHTSPAFANDTEILTVDENSAGDTIVGTIVAVDEDGDTLQYLVRGTGLVLFLLAFDFEPSTGEITVRNSTHLDYETKSSYSITVGVSDAERPDGTQQVGSTVDDSVDVTINVTDLEEGGRVSLTDGVPITGTPFTASVTDPDGGVDSLTWQWSRTTSRNSINSTDISGATDASYTPVDADLNHYLRATANYTDRRGPGKSTHGTSEDRVIDSPYKVPAFLTDTLTISVDENSAPRHTLYRIFATDPDGDHISHSVGGTDASAFNEVFILSEGGTLAVKPGATLDYESKSSYSITVNVTDGEDIDGNAEVTATIDDSIDVTITINNLEEAGLVTLSTNTPLVGSEYRATLTDPDGGITALTWQWAKAASSTGTFTDISGATSANYTPVDADDNEYLRAKANYNDAQGSGKSALRVSNRQASTSPFNPPAFDVDSITFNLAENTAGRVTVGTVVATDDDGDTVYYVLGGPDAAAFTSETSLSQPGASIILRLSTRVDYETKQSYSLILSVTDREDEDGNPQTNHTVDDTVQITVNVLNVEEPGRLVLQPNSLEQGINATVSLTDPDGSLSNIGWQWSRSDSGSGPFSDITGATGPNYVPVLPDKHKFLKVRVSYTDGQGSGKSAELITYVYAGQTTVEPSPVDFPMTRHTRGALRVGETSTGRLDSVDDNLDAPEHAARIPRGDMFKIEGLTAGNSYRVRAWFGTSKEDSATAARGGAIGLQFSRSGIELASLSPHNDNLLDDGRASFVFPAFANDEYYVDIVAPAFRPPSWAFPAHIYFGPYMLEIYDLGPTQTPSQPEGYGVKASNICVNNRCYNDPRFPEFHEDGHETDETHEVSVGNNPTSKDLIQAVAFRADSSGSPTASFKLDRIGAFVHAMTGGSIAQAAIHASTSSGPGAKLFDLEPLLNDDRHIDYFVAPRKRRR